MAICTCLIVIIAAISRSCKVERGILYVHAALAICVICLFFIAEIANKILPSCSAESFEFWRAFGVMVGGWIEWVSQSRSKRDEVAARL